MLNKQLQFLLIPLDIFLKNIHNKESKNELDAWLSFLVFDSPEDIIKLIKEYPEFKPLYQHIYDMCRNVERMMGMFSEELRILDRNTVRYMVDQMQQKLDENKITITEQEQTIQNLHTKNQVQDTKIQEQNAQIQEQSTQIQEQNTQIQEQNAQIQELKTQIQELLKQHK